MLLVVLLVLAAGGVLVGSVVVNQPDWAWLAVLLCAVGAVLLVVARVRRRREASSSTGEPATLGDGQPGRHGDVDSPENPTRSQAEAESSGEPAAERVRQVDLEAEPDEEATEVADSLVVSELDAEVVVLDERPRYHLAGCEWLGERQAIPLPVSKARGLGVHALRALCTRRRAGGRRARFQLIPRRCEPGAEVRYPGGSSGDDPAITGEPPEERAASAVSVEPDGSARNSR